MNASTPLRYSCLAVRLRRGVSVALLLFVAACTGTQGSIDAAKRSVPGEGNYKVGNPYQIAGQWYYPKVDYAYDESGVASWYGPQFHGNRTANGEIFDMNSVSAAHRTLPLPSIVRVINLENGRSLVVRVNDRGPYARGRIIDLSKRAAELLGFADKGTAMVRVQILPEASQRVAMELGARNLADLGPPPPKASPSVAVSVEALRPANGVVSARTPLGSDGEFDPPGGAVPPPFDGMTGATGGTPDQTATATPVAERQIASRGLIEPGETVTVVPVDGRPQIFIQAGAFARYDNANRVRARLSVLGPPVEITQVYVTGQPLFRVRLGPLVSVEEADSRLDQVLATGIEEAQIVVD